jgi:hypothetical protein
LLPPAVRWARPCANASAQILEGMLPSGDEGNSSGLAAFGRGGMALRVSRMPLFLGQCVSFDLEMDSGLFTKVEGNGVVRWLAQDADGDPAQFCGIEFSYLSDESRAAYVNWAETKRIVPFIPDLRQL